MPARALACRLFPPDSTDRYAVLQQGKHIGSHVLNFSRENGRFIVDVDTRFEYQRTGRGTVSFVHRAKEIWIGGWLNAFQSSTRHGNQRISVEAETLEQAMLTVRSDDDDIALQVTGYVVTSSLWHRDTRLVNRLIDLVDGRLKLVKVYYAGKDVVSSPGAPAVAAHYRIRGEINRDVWYGEDCRLLREERHLAEAASVTMQLL